MNDQEYLEATDLIEPGYYWWLPEFVRSNPEDPANWSIRSWHPSDPSRPTSGLFVGPLQPPTIRKTDD